jgi:hypothetical protein
MHDSKVNQKMDNPDEDWEEELEMYLKEHPHYEGTGKHAAHNVNKAQKSETLNFEDIDYDDLFGDSKLSPATSDLI